MEQKLEFVENCLKEAERYKPKFTDVRVFSMINDDLVMKNSQIEKAFVIKEKGFNVRVIFDDAWGYASSYKLDTKEIPEVVKSAIKVAKASGKKLRKPVQLTEEPVITDSYTTPYKIDPFDVDLKEKLELLKQADSIMRKRSDQIKVAESRIDANRVIMAFGNSEGSRIKQVQTYVGCQVIVTAKGTETHNRDSHDYKMKGFEFCDEFNFEEQARISAEEALTLVNKATNCPKEKTTFILEPYQLGLTIHESTGHPTELDRVLGFEADLAGTSFLTPDKFQSGDYKYGSEIVNLVCDPNVPHAIGSIKYDDEGVKTKKFNLIENGIFKNYMTDRETALEMGYKHSFGNARIANYNRIPLIRMSNIHLAPDQHGPKNIDELVEETKYGVFGQFWKSHSIDDKRINFQFSTQTGYLIENGEITKPLKNVCYNAITPEFWGGCDMITQDSRSYGMGPACGKGVPVQGMWIEHGGGWARFQNVQVFAG
ncbi:MAG: TldD/PmbA family protein [Candidatus Kariarchaeaceae archaeon]|jgi:TldD protein